MTNVENPASIIIQEIENGFLVSKIFTDGESRYEEIIYAKDVPAITDVLTDVYK